MPDQKAQIFIVGDTPGPTPLLEILSAEGYPNVSSCSDPSIASSEAARIRPDLIITNLELAGSDDFSLLQQLRAALGDASMLPIIAIRPKDDADATARALELGATEFLSLPINKSELLLRVRNVLQTKDLLKELRLQSVHLEEKLKDRTTRLWDAIKQLEMSEKKVRDSQEETVTRLSIAAEFRDDEALHHIQRMSHYCGLLATAAGLDRDRADMIRVASEMHDVGKIGIPDGILKKLGRLTPQERSIMEQHTVIGHQILHGSHSELLQVAATIAESHHERVDGSGYPRGLKGDEIPLEARIAAIADVFDALTTDRIYRRAFDLTTALRTMREGRGTQFDAGLLDSFFASISEVLNIKDQHGDKGATAAHDL